MTKLVRFLSLDRGKKALALRTLYWILIYRVSLILFPVRSSRWSTAPLKKPETSNEVSDPEAPERIVRAVRIVSRFVPGATCLTQALAARKLLEREGRIASLKIGVAKDGTLFLAHAWLELDGRIILGKQAGHTSYYVLT